MALVELRSVSKIYRLGDEEIRALDNITLDIDEGEFQTHEVARALVGAIESSAPNKSDVILGATAALLGEAGLDAQREEQERIADTGAVPLVVTLVEHDGRTVAVMVTVIPMPAATLH